MLFATVCYDLSTRQRCLNYLLVVISNRLVTSPCAIVAAMDGYTANVQKMMSSLPN